jgi:hypothetical protein
VNETGLFILVNLPLYLNVAWLIMIHRLLEKIEENTKKEGEQK